jgi:DNA-binding NarL/FixJ family response regulator
MNDCYEAFSSLSPKTVDTYRARMMENVGIHNLANLIEFAIQQGVGLRD